MKWLKRLRCRLFGHDWVEASETWLGTEDPCVFDHEVITCCGRCLNMAKISTTRHYYSHPPVFNVGQEQRVVH